MNLLERFKFFFTTFHTGTVNIILHLISAIPLFVGLVVKRLSLIVGFYFIESSGHVYNYLFKFDEELRKKSKEVIPLQILLPALFVLILMILFNWF